MRNIVVVGLFLLLCFPVRGQEVITINHAFLNPYIYNPAFAGKDGKANLSLNHRQQWRGIENAPVTSVLSFDIALENKVNLGLKVINDQKSILNNTTGFLTLGYTVPFSSDQKHALTFGMSAGITKQTMDKNESYNFSDPAVIGLFNSQTHFLGEFGVYYRFNDFALGLALPTLFNTHYATEKADFDPLNEVLLMANYTFVLSENKLTFAPHLQYRIREELSGQLEVTGILRFYETFWIGGLYRQNYGAATLIGLSIGDNISLGYAYELASSQVNGFSNGSHEIQLSLTFDEILKRLKPRYRH